MRVATFKNLRRTRRVPFIQQKADTECGLACMAMVLSGLGRATSLSELRERFPAGRDGLGTQRLIQVAAEHGLSSKAYSTAGVDLTPMPHPLIVHWGFKHWVVVEKCERNSIRIIDPAVGRRTVSNREFSNHFTGVLICFRTTEEFVPRRRPRPGVTWKFFRRLVHEAEGYRLLPLALVCSLMLQILAFGTAGAIKIIVDTVLPHRYGESLGLIGMALIAMTATHLLLGLLRGLIVVRFRTLIDSKSMTEVLHHLLRLPFSFFNTHSRGDLISRVSGFANIRQIVADNGISAVLDGVFGVAYLIWISSLSPFLATIIGAMALVQILALLASARTQAQLSRTIYTASAEQTSSLVDVLSGIEYLKASGSETAAWDRWANLLRAEQSAGNRRAYLNMALNLVSGICHMGGPFVVLWAGTRMVLAGTLSPGAMLSISAIVGAVFWPLANCVNAIQQMQAASAHIERLDDVLAAPVESENTGGRSGVRLGGGIEFAHVWFSYPGSSQSAIEDVSFRIEAGESLGLVGVTGSGKSTLAALLVGLNDPSSGKIYFDGIDIAEISRQELRHQIGYLPQTPLLFRGTLRDNIAFGDPNATLAGVREAARLALIDEDIEKMPLGYETGVAEQGYNFSGGQRQRIALARALIRRPRILILDEGTSNLDTETESRLGAMLATISCTRILITHRLSTIQGVNRVFVIAGGRVVEAGSPPELIRKDGRFASMMRAQAEAQIA